MIVETETAIIKCNSLETSNSRLNKMQFCVNVPKKREINNNKTNET